MAEFLQRVLIIPKIKERQQNIVNSFCSCSANTVQILYPIKKFFHNFETGENLILFQIDLKLIDTNLKVKSLEIKCLELIPSF